MALKEAVIDKRQAGFTIIEVLFAMVILLIGVLGTVTLLNTANASSQTTQARNQATNVARNVIEVARAIKYTSIKPTVNSAGQPDTSFVTALQATTPISGPNLADDDPIASGWQIINKGVTYTLT